MKYILLLLYFLLIFACRQNDVIPNSVIPPDEMGKILFEANMAEEFVNSYVMKDRSKNKETEMKREYEKIFFIHNITEQQFKKSYDFYRSHPEIYKSLMDSLDAKAQRKRSDVYSMGAFQSR
ncbi:MAG: DUF4296 domain-containing protein [Bacteroidetes bacterium]|nr:DUF4296 domain-containing protein [Bacteroidota bacterium]